MNLSDKAPKNTPNHANNTNHANEANLATNSANNTKAKGADAENIAKAFLQNSGFEIVGCNYFTRYGEIDIIAKKDFVYHFIEVKSGKNFNPLQNVTPKKLSRIVDSIHIYLADSALDVEFCVDVVVIKNGEIEFFENISAQI